jgi:ATP-dependent protease HslVU (ClpYQ) peptidase subunit
MTAIAAKFNKDNTKVIIGADSQTTHGGRKYTDKETSQTKSKVIKIDETFAIACCGAVEEISLFQRYCMRTKPKDSTEDAIFDFMCDFNTWVAERIKSFEFHTSHIIVFKGKLFTASYGWTVYEHLKHASGGSGRQCIDVCFDMGGDVEEAIGMAKKYNLYCGGDTKTIELTIK